MSFLYPAFLIGAAAIALPIVLHLLRRDIAPEVPFTAVHLLRKSPVERSKRRRLRDLILLAARVVALLLLATAFARPYRTDAAAASRVAIIALDRSFSMGLPGRFERALELARAAIDGSDGGSVAVIGFDERADLLAAPGSAAQAREVLEGLRPGSAGTRFGALVTKAIETAGGSEARLVVITDLQRAGWEGEQKVAVPSSLTVEVQDAGDPPSNAAIVQARTGAGTVNLGIRNAGPKAFAGSIRLRVNERDVASAPVTVPAGSTVDVPIRYQAPDSGVLTATLDDPAGFAADNIRYLLLDPAPRRRVTIIGAGGSSSGFYLSRAFAAANEAGDELDVELLTGTALARLTAENLAERAAIVVLSTRGLDRRVREMLSAFVRSGGGLWIAAGPDLEASVLTDLVHWPEPPRPVEQDGRAFTLSPSDLRHPVFRPFGSLAANLGQIRFERIWRVPPEGWDVAARFSDGTPALLERREGSGRMVLFASDVDRRWNDFPLHSSFVPFAVETLRYVMREGQREREHTVGRVPAGVPSEPGVHRVPPDGHAVVVNVDSRESSIDRLTPEEFAGMLQIVEVPAAGRDNLRAQETEASQGYWRYGLLLMLAALVGESFLGRAAA